MLAGYSSGGTVSRNFDFLLASKLARVEFGSVVELPLSNALADGIVGLCNGDYINS